MAIVDNSGSDASLNDLADAAADDIEDLEVAVDEREEFLNKLPASAQWMAKLHGKFRSSGRVKGRLEWEYFNENILRFQGVGPSDEADNYSSFNFSAFAKSWNKWVDSLKYQHAEVTYKTSSHLKDAYKSMKRRAVRDATIRPHSNQLEALHGNLTNADNNRFFTEQFAEPTAATVARPLTTTRSASTQTTDNHMEDTIPPRVCDRRKHRASRTKIQRRCRRCGKTFADDRWKPFHVPTYNLESDCGKRHSTRFLRNTEGNAPHETCTVPVEDYEPGFPQLDMSKRLPKRTK